MVSEEVQSKVIYNLIDDDGIKFTILFDNIVATLYINNEIALTARMYSANQMEWAFFCVNSNVALQDVEV